MYKNIEKRRENWRRWYKKHKKEHKERTEKYRKTELGKQSSIRRARTQMGKNPEKWKARQNLRNAVYRGKIKKLPCEVCGDVKVQAHHDDYSKPFEVKWLCSFHHKQLHGYLV